MFRPIRGSLCPGVNNVRAPENKRADVVRQHRAGSHHNHPLTKKGHVMAIADSTAPLNVAKEVAAMERMTNASATLRGPHTPVISLGTLSPLRMVLLGLSLASSSKLTKSARRSCSPRYFCSHH